MLPLRTIGFLIQVCSVVEAKTGVKNANLHLYFSVSENTTLDNSDWISRIPDSRSIRDITIPGTHNAASFYGGLLAQCQSLPLLAQYKAGVRFVDIRCRHTADELPIYHGIMYQRNDLYGVLTDTVAFLNEHPREIILMRIRQESTGDDNTRSMTDSVLAHVQSHPQHRFWNSQIWPSLGEARGKIIILQQFDSHRPIWVPYHSMKIEDHWNVPALSSEHLRAKWRHVKKHLRKFSRGRPPIDPRVHLGYTSGASFWALPYAVAKRINKRLWNFFRLEQRRNKGISYGIIGMDFPGDFLINQMVEMNFLEPSVTVS